MKEEKLYDKKMYNLSAGKYCGLFMEEDVMKQVLKAQNKYINEVKKIFNSNKEKLKLSYWTLANKKDEEGNITKQVIIKFFLLNDTEKDINDRINLFKVEQPQYIKELYMVKNYEEAKKIAEEVLQEQLED